MRGKTLSIILGITFIVSVFWFYVINQYFTMDPKMISGNGNPVILIMFLLVPVFLTMNILFVFIVMKITKEIPLIIHGLILLICAIIFGTCFVFEENFISHLVGLLNGGPFNTQSRIYKFGWFNIYTNSMFFNQYTFVMTMCVSLFIGQIGGLIYRIKEKVGFKTSV